MMPMSPSDRALRASDPSPRGRAVRAALLALALVGCTGEDPTEPGAELARGVTILNGFGRPGVTTLDTALVQASFVDLGSDFDAGAFTVKGDTVAAASSKGAGDKLYIVDLATTSTRTVQLPAGSNPSGVEFLRGTGDARFAVALRDAGEVAVVSVPTGNAAPTITRIGGAGVCPNDAVLVGDDLWSVDANSRCSTDYAVLGPARLIRVASAQGRDTIDLGTQVRGSGTSATELGGYIFVASTGVANFATGQVTVPGAIAKVIPSTGEVVSVLQMPVGTWGAGMRVGLDGRLYVVAYENLTTFTLRVYAVDPGTMTFTGTRATGQQYLRLAKAAGGDAACASASADADGTVYCVENGVLAAARVYVFTPDGDEIRNGAAGQGAVDLTLLR